MIEMQVYGLALDEATQVPILILKDKEEKNVLPIWIGAMEAVAISLVLNEISVPRPMTHDLLLQTIEQLGAEVQKVAIVDLKDGTYFAQVVVLLGGDTISIDSRPSDAIALALRAKAPIFTDQKVLEQVVTARKEKAAVNGKEAEDWADLLERFSLDDIKYKM
ncbi:MAG: bifunctional nuclease family protein [Desulfovibrionales bacterium]